MQSQLVETDEDASPSANLTPEQRLLAAVIRRAVWDFVLYRECGEDPGLRECASRAAGWLFWDGSEKIDEEGRMTFLYVCSVLNLRPEVIRRNARKMRREDVPTNGPIRDM